MPNCHSAGYIFTSFTAGCRLVQIQVESVELDDYSKRNFAMIVSMPPYPFATSKTCNSIKLRMTNKVVRPPFAKDGSFFPASGNFASGPKTPE